MLRGISLFQINLKKERKGTLICAMIVMGDVMDREYQTKSGDTWDRIAKEMYGGESYVSFLMANNQEHLGYFIFPEGISLAIKDLPREDKSVLPNWRR